MALERFEHNTELGVLNVSRNLAFMTRYLVIGVCSVVLYTALLVLLLWRVGRLFSLTPTPRLSQLLTLRSTSIHS